MSRIWKSRHLNTLKTSIQALLALKMQLWGLFEIDILDLFSQYMQKGCKNPRLLQYGDRSRLCLCHNESALGPFLGCFYLFLDHVCVSEHPWRNWLITLGEWWIRKRSQRLQITIKSTVQSSLCWAKLQPVNLVTRLKTAAYRTAPLFSNSWQHKLLFGGF